MLRVITRPIPAVRCAQHAYTRILGRYRPTDGQTDALAHLKTNSPSNSNWVLRKCRCLLIPSYNMQNGCEIKALVDGQFAHPLASSLASFTHSLYSRALLRSFAGRFLDAYSHLCKRACLLVHPLVSWSICNQFLGAICKRVSVFRPSVGRSVTPSHFRLFPRALEHRVASIGSCLDTQFWLRAWNAHWRRDAEQGGGTVMR